MANFCLNCGQPVRPGDHSCYDVFANNMVSTQLLNAANTRLERIKQQAAEIERLKDWQQIAVQWLPKCGTVCQCQGECTCVLKTLRRQAAAQAQTGESDG